VSLIDRVLKHIPQNRRSEFLRVVHELNIPPDSPDLVQAFLATESVSSIMDTFRAECAVTLDFMREEREKMAETASALPDGLRSAGAEIVKGLAQDVAGEAVEAIKTSTVTYMTKAAQVASDAITDAHSDLSVSISSLAQAASKAISDHRAAADTLHDEGRAALAAVKRFQWTRLGWEVAALLIVAILTAWATYAMTLSTQRNRWYAAGYSAGVHHGATR
jgi:hypothetical protein